MSTKVTIFSKDNWHFYYDYKDLKNHLEVDQKEVELPNSFLKTIGMLAGNHEAFKSLLKTTQELDKYDGGLFAIDLRTGDAKEFK